MAKKKRTQSPAARTQRGNGHEAASTSLSRPRPRAAWSRTPWRILPWLVLTAALHAWLFVFPLPQGDDRAAALEEKRRKLTANLLQLEAIQEQLQNPETPPVVAPAEPQEPEQQPEPHAEPERATPEPPREEASPQDPVEERPQDPTSVVTPEPEREMPERTVRKAIEGAETEVPASTEPEGTGGEPPAETNDVGEEATTSDANATSATELARREVQAILDEPLAREGHFRVAFGKWQAQAARKLGETTRGAEGEEDGMPHVAWTVPFRSQQLLSALDLFGGEIFLQNDARTWWHMARDGERFEPRFVTREQVVEIARARGLNISFAKPLELVGLPESLAEARRHAMADSRWVAGTESRIFNWFGTTREQSLVSERAQTFLRRNKGRFPQYAYWEDAKVIQYRYLSDANDRVYDVEVTGLE